MSENEPTLLPGTKPDDMFPILDPAQQARLADQGTVRQVKPDETLVEAGARNNRFFVVLTGELNILRVSEDREEVVAVVASGAFTGEISMLSGRRGLVRVRAAVPSEVIEIDREQLLSLIQTDSVLSDIFLRAFILRRLELITRRRQSVKARWRFRSCTEC
jgi:thioredoxin reductase (NADPH)